MDSSRRQQQMQICLCELYVKTLNWELSWGHVLTLSCQCWKDRVASLMSWTTSSLSFEADKPFNTVTNILLQLCLRKGKEMGKGSR